MDTRGKNRGDSVSPEDSSAWSSQAGEIELCCVGFFDSFPLDMEDGTSSLQLRGTLLYIS